MIYIDFVHVHSTVYYKLHDFKQCSILHNKQFYVHTIVKVSFLQDASSASLFVCLGIHYKIDGFPARKAAGRLFERLNSTHLIPLARKAILHTFFFFTNDLVEILKIAVLFQ